MRFFATVYTTKPYILRYMYMSIDAHVKLIVYICILKYIYQPNNNSNTKECRRVHKTTQSSTVQYTVILFDPSFSLFKHSNSSHSIAAVVDVAVFDGFFSLSPSKTEFIFGYVSLHVLPFSTYFARLHHSMLFFFTALVCGHA